MGKIKHGDYKTGLYCSWKEIKYRCNTPTAHPYKDYGGRGIKVCDRWNEYLNFKEDMGSTWSQGMTLERKDVNGNYEPSNCVWVTKEAQNWNKRNTIFINTPAGRMALPEAAKKYKINLPTLRSRLLAGFTSPEYLFAPLKQRSKPRKRGSLILPSPWGYLPIKDVSILSGLCYSALLRRYNKHGENMSFEPFKKGGASKPPSTHSE